MYGPCRVLSVPGLAWHISRTQNFQGRQQGAGMGTEDNRHTGSPAVPRGLSAGSFTQSPPGPPGARHQGSCLFLPTALALIKHAGKTLWVSVFSGVPKIPQSRKTAGGQGRGQLPLE